MKPQLKILFVSLMILLIIPFGLSVKTGSDSGSLDFRSENEIIIGNAECLEHWVEVGWEEDCINGQQEYICYDKNSCDTEEIKPEKCGETRSCTLDEDNESGTETNDDSGSGSSRSSSSDDEGDNDRSSSSSSSLTSFPESEEENLEWECGEWSECVDNIKTRNCTEKQERADDRKETRQCSPVQVLNKEETNSESFVSKLTGNFVNVMDSDRAKASIALLIICAFLIALLIISIKKYQ